MIIFEEEEGYDIEVEEGEESEDVKEVKEVDRVDLAVQTSLMDSPSPSRFRGGITMKTKWKSIPISRNFFTGTWSRPCAGDRGAHRLHSPCEWKAKQTL